MKTFAVILARGGSKGIPKKNIMKILGKPLIKWSIEQALNSSVIEDVYVSSDDSEILECAEESGAIALTRPAELSGDQSTSEAGWLDVLSRLHPRHLGNEFFFALQATSPVRDAFDFDLLKTSDNSFAAVDKRKVLKSDSTVATLILFSFC